MVFRKIKTSKIAVIISVHCIFAAVFLTLCIALNQKNFEIKITTAAHLTETNPFLFPPTEAALGNIIENVHKVNAYLDRGPRLLQMFNTHLSLACNDWEIIDDDGPIFIMKLKSSLRFAVDGKSFTNEAEAISRVENCFATAREKTERYYERAREARLNTAMETLPPEFLTRYSSLVASQGLNINAMIRDLGSTELVNVDNENTTLSVPKISLGLLGITLSLIASLLVFALRQKLTVPSES